MGCAIFARVTNAVGGREHGADYSILEWFRLQNQDDKDASKERESEIVGRRTSYRPCMGRRSKRRSTDSNEFWW